MLQQFRLVFFWEGHDLPDQDRAGAIRVDQHVRIEQHVAAIRDEESDDDRVGEEFWDSPSAHDAIANTCPAWPVHELPFERRMLVTLAYADESYLRLVGTYLAAAHGWLWWRCCRCRPRSAEAGTVVSESSRHGLLLPGYLLVVRFEDDMNYGHESLVLWPVFAGDHGASKYVIVTTDKNMHFKSR